MTEQQALFGVPEASMTPQQIVLEDAHLLYFPHAFRTDEADRFLDYCLTTLSWKQDQILIAGKRIPLPRLQSWYGDPGAHYGYSGLALDPLPWTSELLVARERVQTLARQTFNSLLANLYRNGFDSVGWHSDNEKELGQKPIIASVSLGVTRVFEMRRVGGHVGGHVGEPKRKVLQIPLTHGSMLLMAGDTQRYWQHQLPKNRSVIAPRVNLTFRTVTLAAHKTQKS